MITLITGMPGAGKSLALMDLIEAAIRQGRPVYASGIPELKLQHFELDDSQVLDWPANVPDGSFVVVDEVQRVFRPRGPGQKVPAGIAALETHRHRGLDFVFVTQHPKLVDVNIRSLVGRHVHLRDTGITGRWWYEWPECSDPNTYRSAPVKYAYRLKKAHFAAYRSSSLHVKPQRRIPPALVVGLVAVLAAVALGWHLVRQISAKVAPSADAAAVAPAGAPASLSPQPAALVAARPASAASPVVAAAVAAPPGGAASASLPRAVGCMSMGNRCVCLGADGVGMRVEWSLCLRSARQFSELVPLELKGSRPVSTEARSGDRQATAAEVSQSWGFNAGDIRERLPAR